MHKNENVQKYEIQINFNLKNHFPSNIVDAKCKTFTVELK